MRQRSILKKPKHETTTTIFRKNFNWRSYRAKIQQRSKVLINKKPNESYFGNSNLRRNFFFDKTSIQLIIDPSLDFAQVIRILQKLICLKPLRSKHSSDHYAFPHIFPLVHTSLGRGGVCSSCEDVRPVYITSALRCMTFTILSRVRVFKIS